MRVTLKLATSLDGRIATAAGESRWITGEAAREASHRLRAVHDAVLVGVATVIADDPALTVRLAGYGGDQPTRVVLDSRQRIPPGSKLVAGAGDAPVIVVSTTAANKALTDAGVVVLQVAEDGGRVDIRAAMAALDGEGLTSVMVEGGGEVAASVLRAGLVDRLEWFRAPMLLGGEGRPAVAGLGLNRLADATWFRRLSTESLGEDLWERYERA
ncbi:MAG TPA: bifunctional diaminohydroxyphosphoribosylaminopyrimidine deaminase/5-amino-6-(5-phosphoribosylamino)uracil reductase RibD [Caulobacteraceae bacterium]|jgi:diaminohydroxyphosphoribosylaminopyrimidine deaminase/5-amino-6-(5-phosphoribosylamino)uracil reductase|nr:bifunctional diaminohydroxyphosphoribosylaminopyrimidine deaminase/5-amino-6-(5-phosphoribosylamino)uracil reductase RibD [Caulobacteraceae bacterium]